MAQTVAVVQTTAAGSGAGVAIDRIGTTDYQLVKLVAGQTSNTQLIEATTAAPSAAAVAIVVREADRAVTVTSSVPVTGTVGVVGTVTVGTGTVSVSGPLTITPTVLTVNTAPTVAGASVTIQQGASVAIAVSISGTTEIAPQVLHGSTGQLTSAGVFGLAVRVAGTAQVQGTVSVENFPLIVTGPNLLAKLDTIVPVITQPSASVTALPVIWHNTAQLSAAVSGTISLVGVVPVTTQASVSVTGLPVWWNQTAAVVVNTAPTVAGASVTIQQGASITGTISVSGVVPVTTAASVSVTGLPVWLNPTQQVVVSGLVGHSVTGTVSLVGIVPVTTAASVSVTGLPVWLNPTQGISAAVSGTVTVGTGTVVALDVGRTQVMIVVTSTSVGISGTLMLFTVYTGAQQAVAGTSGYIIPAGKTFRVLSQALVAGNSVTSAPVTHRLFVCPTTAAPTWTSTMPVAAAVALVATSAGIGYSACGVQVADVAAGATLAIAHTIATSGGSIVQAVVNGYLFP